MSSLLVPKPRRAFSIDAILSSFGFVDDVLESKWWESDGSSKIESKERISDSSVDEKSVNGEDFQRNRVLSFSSSI